MVFAAAQVQSVVDRLDLDEVYREHAQFVWTNLRRFGVAAEYLEDAVHDVFVVAYRRAASFDPERASIRTWIFGITRRVAADWRRSRMRYRRRLEAFHSHRLACRPEPRTTARAEVRVILADLLDSIGETDAELFVLSQLHGMPLARIALHLGLNRNTAASRLRAIRKRFAKRLHGSTKETVVERAMIELTDAERDEPMPERARHRVLAGLVAVWSSPVRAVPTAKVALALIVLFGALVISGVVGGGGTQRPILVTRTDDSIAPTRLPRLPLPSAQPNPSTQLEAVVRATDPTRESRKSRARARPAVTAPEHAPSAAEVELVLRARKAVRGGLPQLALELHDEYRRRFPDGALSREMGLIRVDAHRRLRRRAQLEPHA